VSAHFKLHYWAIMSPHSYSRLILRPQFQGPESQPIPPVGSFEASGPRDSVSPHSYIRLTWGLSAKGLSLTSLLH
jgi:hypothetical protein